MSTPLGLNGANSSWITAGVQWGCGVRDDLGQLLREFSPASHARTQPRVLAGPTEEHAN